jgi:AraC family transcriptional regulator
MVAGERMAVAEPVTAPLLHGGQEAPTLTLSLTREAMGALDAYLQSGAARGLIFEQPLLDALRASHAAEPGCEVPAARSALSPRTLRRVHEYIVANLASDFRIEDIAQAACLSACHLGHSFRQATGQSLWQYVLHCRARFACELIAAQPRATLAAIAAQCGFEAYSQFIAAFRKAYGLTPSSYRRGLDQAQQ